MPGYNLDQEIEALRAKALAFAPDLVVVAFCLNDLEGLFSYELGLVQDRAARGRSLPGRVREWLLGRSLLFSWVEYRLSELEARRSFVRARNPLDGPLYAEAVGQQQAALEGKLAVLRSLLAARGIPGVVVVFPVLGAKLRALPAPRAPPGGRRGGREARPGGGGPPRLLRGVRLPRAAGRRRAPEPARPPRGGPRRPGRAVRARLALPAAPAGPSCAAYRPADFPAVQGY